MKLENCSCSADLQTSCIDGDGCMSLNQGYSQGLYLSGRLFVDNEGIRKVKDAEHVWFVTDFPRHVHMCMTNPLQHPFGGRLLFRANCSFSSPPAALSSSRENPEMEIFLSAALGELSTRSINFFISKFTRPQALDMEDRLRWVLLRARVIEDEAMGRNITNQAMLQQLDMLRDSMYRGYFKLDSFRYQYHHDKEEANDLFVSYYLLLSKVNSVSLLAEECAMECQNCALNKDGRLLIVIEIAGDLTEDAWNKLCSASKRHVTNSTKIIITSGSDKIMKLGTTGGVTLKYPPKEAYWYFFKTLTFQGMDPEDHPRLASLAMKIAMTLNGSLIVGNMDARLLRDNF
ncbi:hypothetical protein HU200_016477 [Digitaria exilis]|uniref:Uncharacterized protein n=1 Tax=Digitaria exilis TaxID=1010633 RepID=A0A835KL26_9POAL|nr:hypothetical protein HU200_016477 [Digitaria exilis]